MAELGVKAFRDGTESYHVLFIIDPSAGKSTASSASTATTTTAAATSEVNEPAYVPSYQRAAAAAAATCKTDVASYKTPSPLDFALSIRMFVNSNARVLALNGRAHPSFNRNEQLTITTDDYINYTFGDLKKAFPDSWPKLEEGG